MQWKWKRQKRRNMGGGHRLLSNSSTNSPLVALIYQLHTLTHYITLYFWLPPSWYFRNKFWRKKGFCHDSKTFPAVNVSRSCWNMNLFSRQQLFLYVATNMWETASISFKNIAKIANAVQCHFNCQATKSLGLYLSKIVNIIKKLSTIFNLMKIHQNIVITNQHKILSNIVKIGTTIKIFKNCQNYQTKKFQNCKKKCQQPKNKLALGSNSLCIKEGLT